MSLGADLRSQFLYGVERLYLGALKVLNLDACVIENLVMIAHEVEEATHVRTSTRLERTKIASGFCRRSEETLRVPSLFTFRSSITLQEVQTVQ